MKNYSLLLLIFWLFTAHPSFGQSNIETLKSNKLLLNEEIDRLEKRIKKYSISIKNTVDRLSATRRKLQFQDRLIKLKRREIDNNRLLIHKYAEIIESLGLRRLQLENEFGQNLNRLYKQKLLNKHKLKTRFEAWNKQLLSKYYTRQYHQRSIAMLDSIEALKANFDSIHVEQKALLASNEDKMRQLSARKALLTEQKQEFERDIARSKKSKSLISEDIRKRKKSLQLLDEKIRAIIRHAQGKAASKENHFGGEKGQFMLPLEGAVVVSPFGEQAHPLVPNLKIVNNGVDLVSAGSTVVRSIDAGVVLSIQEIPAAGKVIIIRHGQYYSVYGSLADVSVQLGEKLAAGQVIAAVSNDTKKLHFELWKNQEKLDPEDWINFE